ncbi:hypothetical protein Clacol_007633 [Clathrus columnatus]|uniref:Spermatogenesis-associated protein 20-like TRX domain-containing protein n=1 Tax=Clathrus columnatus TaxID=1419009 RepID=A0AAV5AGB7_9AGAM|nr:hypothetical protein Clacol_007633 [Clathrus columnatus]
MLRSICTLPSYQITRRSFSYIIALPSAIFQRPNTYIPCLTFRSISTTQLPRADMNHSNGTPNRLANAKSPYLLQHAYNPVDWYEWSEEAFTRAAELNKPIFLSVGYSACHWCHVLAHESFEDQEIANIMNKSFINIKVDREERPDVDRIYMTFVQATSGRGGWPMSVWLTPELAPFFAGTYFPRDAFKVLCERISETWHADPSKVRTTGNSVIQQLQDLFKAQPRIFDINVHDALKRVFDKWKSDFDPIHGGFGDAPKVPFIILMKRPLTDEPLVPFTIHDLLSSSPMLYDQAQLITFALECSTLLEDPFEKRKLQAMALDILEYIARDLRSPEGAFYSSEDADSLPSKLAIKPKEGAFYVWKKDTIDEILGDRAPIFEDHFGVNKDGNIDPKHDAHNELAKENQLYIRTPIIELAKKYNLPVHEAHTIINECLLKLRQYRDTTRPRPHLDDKIVTAWNGLVLSALARSASVLEHDLTFPGGKNAVKATLDMAGELAMFIKERLWDSTSKELCRSWRQGRGPSGMCEDYAAITSGFLDMYEATGNEEYLMFAYELQKRQDELFWDEDDGGYFASPSGDPRILVRLKDNQDGAEPSALSVSLSNLYRLASLITDEEYDLKSKAERTLSSQSNMIAKAPYALGMMVGAAEMGTRGMKEVIITGYSEDESTRTFLRYVRSKFVPNRSLIHIDPNFLPKRLAEQNQVVRSLVDSLSTKATASLELPEVRVCEAGVCGLPLKGIELELLVQ